VLLVLCLLAALMLAPYVLGPVLVKARFRHYPMPRLTALEEGDIPEDVEQVLARYDEGLTALGYVTCGRRRMDAVTDVSAFIAVLVNPDTKTMACASALVHRKGSGFGSVTASSVEFYTRFSNGREILTNNSRQPLPFGPVRGQAVIRFVDLDDVAELVRLHDLRVRLANRGEGVLPAPGKEFDRVADATVRWLEAQQARGHLQRDSRDESYRLTWKGAWKATWKQLWPFDAMALKRARQMAEQVSEALRDDPTVQPEILAGDSADQRRERSYA
jgi:hypothetical protein